MGNLFAVVLGGGLVPAHHSGVWVICLLLFWGEVWFQPTTEWCVGNLSAVVVFLGGRRGGVVEGRTTYTPSLVF